MTAADFRRIALGLEGVTEGSHMGAADFRVGGRIFATLASQKQGYGNLMLTPELQAAFVAGQPAIFLPVPGGWGKNGVTHIRLAQATEDILHGALHSAWKLRAEKNRQPGEKAADARRNEENAADLEDIRIAEDRLTGIHAGRVKAVPLHVVIENAKKRKSTRRP